MWRQPEMGMQRCVNMLKQDLHTAGVSALGTMWVVLFPKMGQGIDADTPWPLLPVHTLPWAFPLGLPTQHCLFL